MSKSKIKYVLELTGDEAAALLAFLCLCYAREADELLEELIDVMDDEDINRWGAYASDFGYLKLRQAERAP